MDFDGNFDGNFDENSMGILMMESMGWPSDSLLHSKLYKKCY